MNTAISQPLSLKHFRVVGDGTQRLKQSFIAVALLLAATPCFAADPAVSPRVWAEIEYLGWWTKGRDLPPLVTTSPAGTPLAQSGVLGQPATLVLFGDNTVGDDLHHGIRFAIGAWLIPDSLGIGLRYFDLRTDSEEFSASSNGDLILTRPFFNTNAAQQDTQLVAFPGLLSGRIDASSNLKLSGFDVFGRKTLHRDNSRQFDLLIGFMGTRVEDEVTIINNSVITAGFVPDGTTFDTLDRFSAKNDFRGISFGTGGNLRHQQWAFSGIAKLGIGRMKQTVTIAGSTTTTLPGGGPATATGGLLAQPSNSGEFKRDRTTLVPEIGINASYALARGIDVTVGYSAIYWSRLVLAGNQIDTNIDLNQSSANPSFRFRDTSYWAHGLNIGLRVEW